MSYDPSNGFGPRETDNSTQSNFAYDPITDLQKRLNAAVSGYKIPDSYQYNMGGFNSTPMSLPEPEGTGWGIEGKGGAALGAGQLGLGLMSYLENKKTAGKQRALYDQQIKQNKYVLENAKGYHDSIRKGFGNIQTQVA